jgi:hypothetical protein
MSKIVCGQHPVLGSCCRNVHFCYPVLLPRCLAYRMVLEEVCYDNVNKEWPRQTTRQTTLKGQARSSS